MYTYLAGRKPTIIRIVLILSVSLAMAVMALPAGATQPEPLNFDFTDVTYYDLPTDTGYGSWTAGGLFSGGGDTVEDPNHSGWDPDGCWRTVHTEALLTDPATGDTITIRTQITKIEGATNCLSFIARANWVVVSGTGAYADLHGQGTGTVSGYLEIEPGTGNLNYVVNYDLDGQGHFD